MDKEPFSNQATSKYLGFVYQVLVAMERCFDANKNQIIWIECYGDIYDGEVSTEVKHHLPDGGLASNSKDFWNTLKNILTEDTDEMGEFILHTAQHIPETSIFSGWNSIPKTKKYSRLKSHIPSETLKPLYDEVMSFGRPKILKKLELFKISCSKEKVDILYFRLQEHKALFLLDEIYRGDVINWLYGYMNQRAIVDYRKWNININDFYNDLLEYCKKFKTGNVPFPYIDEDNEKVTSGTAESFKFTQELDTIGLKKSHKSDAVSDYLRSALSEMELLTKKPQLMTESITKFEESTKRKCRAYKSKIGDDLSLEDLGEVSAKTASRKVFWSSPTGHFNLRQFVFVVALYISVNLSR